MRDRSVHSALLAWGAWRMRDCHRIRPSLSITRGQAKFESYWQRCPLCLGKGRIINGTSERCPKCNGAGGASRRVMLCDPKQIRKTGPGGMIYTPDPDDGRLSKTPKLFTDIEAELGKLSFKNQCLVLARYAYFPRAHFKTHASEIGGIEARLAWLADVLHPYQMTRTQYGDRLTRIKH